MLNIVLEIINAIKDAISMIWNICHKNKSPKLVQLYNEKDSTITNDKSSMMEFRPEVKVLKKARVLDLTTTHKQHNIRSRGKKKLAFDKMLPRNKNKEDKKHKKDPKVPIHKPVVKAKRNIIINGKVAKRKNKVFRKKDRPSPQMSAKSSSRLP